MGEDDDDSEKNFVNNETRRTYSLLNYYRSKKKDNQFPLVQLRRSKGAPFEVLENISQSVIKSLFDLNVRQLKSLVYHLN